MVNDFVFIQPFGGNRVPIDEGRKSQKGIRVISIWSPHCDHKYLVARRTTDMWQVLVGSCEAYVPGARTTNFRNPVTGSQPSRERATIQSVLYMKPLENIPDLDASASVNKMFFRGDISVYRLTGTIFIKSPTEKVQTLNASFAFVLPISFRTLSAISKLC
jgi:hypothetical protein